MAANKFATMLHRNTNKITLILIYAVLEWILIVLLLLNSLFSYLIIKFADYFGLKPPCPWCSRVDHFFEPDKGKNSHRDLLCEIHSAEISKLGYCSNHRKLVESQDMCEDCSSSRPDFFGFSKDFDLFPWVKQIGMIENDAQKVFENGDFSSKCSCCGLSFDRKSYSPCIVIKPTWDVLDYPQKGNLITEADDDDDQIEKDDRSDYLADRCVDEHWFEENCENLMISEVNGGFDVREDEHGLKENCENLISFDVREDQHGFKENCGNLMNFEVDGGFDVREEGREREFSVSVPNPELRELGDNGDDKVGVVLESDKEQIKEESSKLVIEGPTSVEINPHHLEFFVGYDGFRLIPVEFDSKSEENQTKYKDKEEYHENSELQVEERKSVVNCNLGERDGKFPVHESGEEPKFALFESMEMEENENSFIFHAKECDSVREVYEEVAMTPAMAAEEEKEMDSENFPVSEEVSQMPNIEMELEVSIGTEIPDLDPIDEIQTQEASPSFQSIHEKPSTSSANLHSNDIGHGSHEIKEEAIECKTVSVETSGQAMDNNFTLCLELNEIEEERVPDTPTSLDSLNQFQRKFLSLERRESSTEESLEGSFISDFEGTEGVMNIERLKSALRTERKALNALYSELEEERSASAVAANQTMAMINRLQEEKAAMQMEALQYQRMMEEQSEYDQEALQLLNELMVKREKENQELERELEVYRKRVLDYEMREKIRMLRRSGNSSSTFSNTEDSDGLSIDLNQETKEEESICTNQENGNQNTPVDAVLGFEEERLSILEQLKSLEEKLFTLTDDEEMKHMDHFYEGNGNHIDENSDYEGELNGYPNGSFKEMNGNHHHHQEKRIAGPKGKRLLPLFDSIGEENENGLSNGHENGIESENCNKVAIEEEVDHLYERLQALEADREFLKHCISSLKKGDKGIDLLQEILQHLRDLRNVELQVRNLGENAIV